MRGKTLYLQFLEVEKSFPKTSRHTLAARIDLLFLSILETTMTATYQKPERKIATLEIVIGKIDTLKFLFQIAWEARCIKDGSYEILSKELHEIGRNIGGWKKSLEIKNSPAGTPGRI